MGKLPVPTGRPTANGQTNHVLSTTCITNRTGPVSHQVSSVKQIQTAGSAGCVTMPREQNWMTSHVRHRKQVTPIRLRPWKLPAPLRRCGGEHLPARSPWPDCARRSPVDQNRLTPPLAGRSLNSTAALPGSRTHPGQGFMVRLTGRQRGDTPRDNREATTTTAAENHGIPLQRIRL